MKRFHARSPRLVRLLLVGLMLTLFSLRADASITYVDLGVGSPPPSLSGVSMTPFGADHRSLSSVVGSVPSPLSGDVSFSIGALHLQVTRGWATWSHGYTGDVYWTQGAQSITLSMPPSTRAFYLYAEPNPFSVFSITVRANDGTVTSSGPVAVNGSAGAHGFGFVATGDTIHSIVVSSSIDFAIGEFGISSGPQLTLLGGLGSGPSDPSTESKDVSQGAVDATFPLGSQFFVQLVKPDASGNKQPVSAKFALGSVSISPAIVGPTLFSNDVAVEFDSASTSGVKYFRAVHLGATTLTITPSDTSITPVTINIRIATPLKLGSTHNAFDSILNDLGHKRGIPPHFLKGQVQQESGFKPTAYRYEPLSVDLGSVSGVANVRTQMPYSLYRLATTDGLDQGANILADDIAPRSIYVIVRNGVQRSIAAADQFVSASDIYTANDASQHWSRYSPARAAAVARNPALLSFTAQTPLAASFGLLQILYTTAIAPMRWNGVAGAQNPSYLFDTGAAGTGSLDAGSGYLRRVFARANPTVNVADPVWTNPADFRSSFVNAFNVYNHNGTSGQYGTNVVIFAASYTPVAAGPIFR